MRIQMFMFMIKCVTTNSPASILIKRDGILWKLSVKGEMRL
jgi:hypothetical protein